LNRTTRSVNVTDAGSRLLEEVAPALRVASAALVNAKTERQGLSGSLRLNVPRVACRVGLPSLLAEYARRHPEVRVEVEVEDRQVDIVLVDSTSVGEVPLMSRLRARFPGALFVSLGLPQSPDFFDDIVETPNDMSRLRTSILGRLAS